MATKAQIDRNNEHARLREVVAQAWKDAGPDSDLAKVQKIGDLDCSKYTLKDRLQHIQTLEAKIRSLEAESEREAADAEAQRQAKGLPSALASLHGMTHAAGAGAVEVKNVGREFIQADGFKEHVAAAAENTAFVKTIDASPTAVLLKSVKATMTTSAGWGPENRRQDVVVPAAVRPLTLLEIMPPAIPLTEAALVYMEESTRTHAASEIAEGGAYSEDSFALTERTNPARKVGSRLPVTDEQLADVAQVERYINSRLMYGVRARLESQILNGDGTAPNLRGILNTTGIQTQALGSDSRPDAVHKAITKVESVGFAPATHIIAHPTDWEQVRLLKTSDGDYAAAPLAAAGPRLLFNIPVVLSTALAAGTVLVGSFMEPFLLFGERQGVMVEQGYVGDQFGEGKSTMRGSGRWAVGVARPAAFCTVTGF